MNLAGQQLANPRHTRKAKVSFAFKATIKGLVILKKILRELIKLREELKKVREQLMRQDKALLPEEACAILQISRSRPQTLKDDERHVEGIHYFQAGATLRYVPNIASLPLEPVTPISGSKNDSIKTEQAHKNITKNAFRRSK